MKDKTLVILAAGMGSRFGSPKQIYPIGPNGEFIMDYSIYSAKRYGFTKVVLVIREELKNEFINTIGKRLEDIIELDYAIQDINNIPDGFIVPEERTKPWGTAHALYCAKDYIKGNYSVISADDFYGDEPFKLLSEAMDNNLHAVIGYHIADTLSPNGVVKRGVTLSSDGYVNKIIESECELVGNEVQCTPLNKSIKPFMVPKNNSVSMLMYALTNETIDLISERIKFEFENNKDNFMNYEFFLPDMLMLEIERGKKIHDIPTDSKWVGVTYKEDVDTLKEHIDSLIKEGIYPNNLWNK